MRLKFLFILSILILNFASYGFADQTEFTQHLTNKALKAYKFKTIKDENAVRRQLVKISKSKHAIIYGSDAETRPKYSAIQALIERSILDFSKAGKISSSVIAIHTDKPPTPLRIIDKVQPGIIPPSLAKIEDKINYNILYRSKSLTELLSLNSKIVSIYSNSILKTKINGYANYETLLGVYPNLIDKQTRTIPNEYSGATYLIKFKSGEIMAFSIHAYQLGSKQVNQDHYAEIWLGNITNKIVSRRVVKVDSFLKSQDIDIFSFLNAKIAQSTLKKK